MGRGGPRAACVSLRTSNNIDTWAMMQTLMQVMQAVIGASVSRRGIGQSGARSKRDLGFGVVQHNDIVHHAHGVGALGVEIILVQQLHRVVVEPPDLQLPQDLIDEDARQTPIQRTQRLRHKRVITKTAQLTTRKVPSRACARQIRGVSRHTIWW